MKGVAPSLEVWPFFRELFAIVDREVGRTRLDDDAPAFENMLLRQRQEFLGIIDWLGLEGSRQLGYFHAVASDYDLAEDVALAR